MKKIILIIFILPIFILLSCSNEDININSDVVEASEISETSDSSFSDTVESHAPENSLSEIIPRKTLYKASYGYADLLEQGYNFFYYEYLESGSYKYMNPDNQNEIWKGNDALIYKAVMTSTENTSAVRAFAAPNSGEITISGNPKLVSGERAAVSIFIDDEQKWQGVVEDKTGIWQENNFEVERGQTIRFIVEGSASVYWNPTVDYTDQPELMLHNAADGFYGDVHPYYNEKDKKLYLFYLSTGKEKNGGYQLYQAKCDVSGDFINFSQRETAVDNPQILYHVLDIYIDKDGFYRSALGNGYSSKSSDLITWQLNAEPYIDEKTGQTRYLHATFLDTGAVDGRDPSSFYDTESGKIYSVMMNYYSNQKENGEKWLVLYTAGEDGKFSNPVKIIDCTGKGDPECPGIKKIGGRWYIFYSLNDILGNLSYKFSEPGESIETVDWDSRSQYAIDGGNCRAAQIFQVENKYYMYGWIYSVPHTYTWGGYINIMREIYQKPDGTLGARLAAKTAELMNKGLITSFTPENSQISGLNATGGRFEISETSDGSGQVNLSGDYGRVIVSADIKLPESADYAFITVKNGENQYYFGIIRYNNKLWLTETKNPAQPLMHRVFAEIRDFNQTDFSLKLILDGGPVEIFANDEYVVTSSTALSGKDNIIGAALSGAGASAENIKIFKLAGLKNIFD